MRRSYILFLLAVILNGIAQGQESLLLKITPPDSKVSSYIFCSTELPGVENFDISTPIAPVMSSVNTVAFFNVPDASEIQNIPVFMKSPGESTLKGYYKREDRIRFELMVGDKLKESVENYYTIKPLYILQLFRDKDHGTGKEYQQNLLLNNALQTGKPTLSLVTIRQIAGVMEEMDFDTQASVLSNYVNNAQAFLDADGKKFTAYSKQNISEYAATEYTAEQAAYITTMINSMNDLLLKKMEPLSTQQSVLYILNADLIGGDYGLIKKLKAKGYTIEYQPINIKTGTTNTSVNNNTTTNTTPAAPANIEPDDFPALTVMPAATMNPEEVKLVNVNELKKNKKTYLGYADPFGDAFDMASADTLFLESWYELKGTDANFKVMVPVKEDWEETETPWVDAGTIKKFIYQTNHAKSDLFYSVGYTVYPPSFNQTDKNKFFNDFIDQTKDQLNGDIIAQRIISEPGYTGREFTAAVGDSFFVRSQFILQDNIFFQLLVGGPGNNPFSAYAEAFLRSFDLSSNAMVNWYLFDQPGFNCYLPTQPSKSSKQYTLPSGPMTVQTFVADDYRELVTYTVTVSAYPPGHKFGNTNSFFDDLIANAERQYIGKASKIEKVKLNGVEGRYVEMQLMNKKTYRIYFYFDGNTVYQFAAGGDTGVLLSLNANRFFNSVQFTAGN